jgi:hypothetical protein
LIFKKKIHEVIWKNFISNFRESKTFDEINSHFKNYISDLEEKILFKNCGAMKNVISSIFNLIQNSSTFEEIQKQIKLCVQILNQLIQTSPKEYRLRFFLTKFLQFYIWSAF